MPKQNLTQFALKSLIKKAGRHADGGGLYFRVVGSGKTYWVFRYRLNGVERETSLGRYPELSLESARTKHAELRKMVKVDKVDPLAQRQAAKSSLAKLSTKPTFGAMADAYIETHERSWRNPKHRRQWVQTLTQHGASIRNTPVDQVTTTDVLEVLKPIWSRAPETAARLRGRIEVIIDAARVLGHIDQNVANPARWKGHLQRLLPKPAKLIRGHHRAMPYAEVPEFFVRLVETPVAASVALRFTILTACRTAEVVGARWEEVDFGAATWMVPASRTKTNKPHDVPLSDQAIVILKALKAQHETTQSRNPHVFAGRPQKPLSVMTMSMLLRRMKIDFTVHGMRASCRMWMADNGVPFDLAEAVLGHSVGNQVVAAYQRSSMIDRRRPIMQSWCDYVCGNGASAKVVPIRA